MGSDCHFCSSFSGGADFNPRSPCGERRPGTIWTAPVRTFQSTLPVWGATPVPHIPDRSPCISIHAPRVGSDAAPGRRVCAGTDFNPRSPCGERHPRVIQRVPEKRFQSTLPVWGATDLDLLTIGMIDISIHAPRVGSDLRLPGRSGAGSISIHAPRVGSDFSVSWRRLKKLQFQSTLPVWGATTCLG